MRIKTMRLVAAIVLATACAAGAQSEPDAVLNAADTAYRAGGPEAFVKKLLEDGPMQGNPDAMAQANMLRSVESFYGSYRSYEVVRTVEVAAQTRFVYTVFNYESGPMFGTVTFFRTEEGWRVVMFKFHTEAAQVWPDALLVQ